ncbi:hypothetical protein ANN_06851 [Periplaneta americana]|uniref:Uncharacterized protein n=1 Tax=Periplaneta americana TaxID=6978 RepID=A0ABQ8TH29_PERAM|nr:hypothetical protein ANN_06851 [Periplaneta americana]
MAGLCEGGNGPADSLKAICKNMWERSPAILNYCKLGGYIRFQSRVDIRGALDSSVREISRNAAADGVRRLPRLRKHIVDTAGDYI